MLLIPSFILRAALLLSASTLLAQAPTPHYLVDSVVNALQQSNRFSWWTRLPPPTAPITQPFEQEFFGPLTTVVGGSVGGAASAGFATVAWDVNGFPGLAAAQGVQFSVRSERPVSDPILQPLRPPGVASTFHVLVNSSAEQRSIQPPAGKFRPSLFLDFNRPQRAVGLEYGFKALTGSRVQRFASSGVRLIALDRAGQPISLGRGTILESRGDRLAGRNIDQTSFQHRIGVRSQSAEIWSVELRFENDGDQTDLKIVEQQAVLRVWHEILPPAAVKQGAVAIRAGALEGAPVGSVDETLPFGCDRAVVLMRGFRLQADGFVPAVGEMAAGVQQRFFTTTPGGTVRVAPFTAFGPIETANPGHNGIVYYSLLAWNSREVDLASADASDAFAFAQESGAAAIVRTDPAPELGVSTQTDATRFRQEMEQRRGPLFGGLGGFQFRGAEDCEALDLFGIGVGSWWSTGQRLNWIANGQSTPQRPLKNLEWWINSGWNGLGAASTQRFDGTLLVGRSLRVVPERAFIGNENRNWAGFLTNTQAQVFDRPATSVRPASGPGRFQVTASELRANGWAFPIAADMLAIGLWNFAIQPNITPFLMNNVPFRYRVQSLECELRGANYDGRNMDWERGGAVRTALPSIAENNHRHVVMALPNVVGVQRDWAFAEGRLNIENGVFRGERQGPAVEISKGAVLKNNGRAQMNIESITPGAERINQQIRYRFAWRGLFFDDFPAHAPLQLRSGESLFIVGTYTPDPSIPRETATRTETASLEVVTSLPRGRQRVEVAVTTSAPFSYWQNAKSGLAIVECLMRHVHLDDPETWTRRVRIVSVGDPVTLRSVDLDFDRSHGYTGFSVRIVPGASTPGVTELEITWDGSSLVESGTVLLAETSKGLMRLPLFAAYAEEHPEPPAP